MEVLNFLENGAGSTDPPYSQRGLPKDGCAYVAKEIQRILEGANALAPPTLSVDAAANQVEPTGTRWLYLSKYCGRP